MDDNGIREELTSEFLNDLESRVMKTKLSKVSTFPMSITEAQILMSGLGETPQLSIQNYPYRWGVDNLLGYIANVRATVAKRVTKQLLGQNK